MFAHGLGGLGERKAGHTQCISQKYEEQEKGGTVFRKLLLLN